MSGDLTWRPLPLATSPGLPVLLVSVDVGTAAYTVRVTDMANIWVESLDRKAICMRGWNENTSIDPSDTTENMAKFLSSLRSALDPSQPSHDQTSLTLSPGSGKEAGREGGLTLRITCPLPGFEPLKWPIHLAKSPASTVATDLVLPLMETHLTRKLEVESLVQALAYKDAVIAKLADKLEATGTGLEHVFTSLSGRKKVTRALAEDKVKGLAAFDQRKWKAGLRDNESWPVNTSDLVQNVFGGDGLQNRSMLQLDTSPKLDKWWHDFQGTSQLAHRSQQQETASRTQRTPSPPVPCTNSDDDDDFQVQSTPPHLRSSKMRTGAGTAPPADDASTAGEEEEKSPMPARHPPTTSSDNKKPATRMGMGIIGGKKQPTAPSSPRSKTPGSRKEKASSTVHDSETASETADADETASIPEDASSPAPAPAPPPPPPKADPKKGGLGRIGGPAAKTHVAEREKSPEAGESEANATAAGPPARKKLGVIGKKIGGAAGGSAAGEDESGRGRGVAVREQEAQAKEQQPREMSQERADRRREELKRELERKVAAGPVKKKRRF